MGIGDSSCCGPSRIAVVIVILVVKKGGFMETDKPTDRTVEDRWRSWAVSLAIAAPILLIAATAWIGSAPTEQAMLTRVNILAPIGVLYVALVTFCTVVWRGCISARQADYQLEQLGALARQIASSELNNVAQQLQRGAELIAEDDEARIGAGIVTLGAIAKEPPDRFGDEARILLLEYVKRFGSGGHASANLKRAAAQLESAFRLRKAWLVQSLNFEGASSQVEWELIFSSRICSYKGGVFNSKELKKDDNYYFRFMNVFFDSCRFEDITPLISTKCRFYNCYIRGGDSEILNRHDFEYCDFTGARIVINEPMPDLRERMNWFQPRYPPELVHPQGLHIDPSRVLHNKMPDGYSVGKEFYAPEW